VIDAYHAYQSVNHVTSHDGFTLYDLLAYECKRNRDGAVENWSSNHGWEGDDNVPAEVVALRQRQAKNLIALLMLSNGTPMLRAGDEFLQTQGGHNNPFDQDNETSWLDWGRREKVAGYARFVREMIGLRRRHPAIARSRFWRDDVRWYGERGVADFTAPTIAWYLRGTSQGDGDLYVMVNASGESASFVIQQAGDRWRILVDTSLASPADIELEGPQRLSHPSYTVEAHSLVVLGRD